MAPNEKGGGPLDCLLLESVLISRQAKKTMINPRKRNRKNPRPDCQLPQKLRLMALCAAKAGIGPASTKRKASKTFILLPI
ncbi:hypothetical protein [Desulfocurvibacter africanus]|uniref:hypothetical protein n=1 Tax=Desulfocurvibacter africanus TaxID=873 RepID=UPI0012681D4F|nr:hypothetical protein [Desulfocurvibacter africanus]